MRLNTLFTVDMRDVALRGWHDVGGECSVVPPECTEIRLCVTHALGVGWREGCGIRVTTAGLQGSISGIVHVSSRRCTVYADVTPPFGNPLGYRGNRPLLDSMELADV